MSVSIRPNKKWKSMNSAMRKRNCSALVGVDRGCKTLCCLFSGRTVRTRELLPRHAEVGRVKSDWRMISALASCQCMVHLLSFGNLQIGLGCSMNLD